MDWKDIAGMVGKAAPMLGTVLTGPLGTAVAVGGMIASAIGTDPTPDAVAAAIAADPAALARIRELELQHDATVRQMAMQITLAELQDVQSARARDVDLAKLGRPNTRADVMVAGATLGLLACLFSLVLYRDKIPPEAVGIISTVASIFGLCLRDAFTFEFGSSRSSQAKDATINDLAKR